ncbi:MAG: gas vesicle protein [Thermoplasmata archaeon]
MMEPTKATLNDLLDRIFEKGIVIHADVLITFAGIPLIALNLRAALASIETMLDYGMMKDWDEATRALERERRRKAQTLPVSMDTV